MRLRSAFAAVLLFVSIFAVAEERNANNERGFDPQKAYAFDEIGTVGLFNGNLNLGIPIGQAYPVSSTLSYRLGLHYGGNNWDAHTDELVETDENGEEILQCDDNGCHLIIRDVGWTFPTALDNAGFGWKLSLGRLDPDPDSMIPIVPHVYESPDGARHNFYGTLHANNTSEPVQPGVFYTRDESYLRLQEIAGGYKLEFPDGTVHYFKQFDPDFRESRGMVTRMEDQHGNSVDIDYDFIPTLEDPLPPGSFAGPSRIWRIEDSHGRRHYIYLKSTASYHEKDKTQEVAHMSIAAIQLETVRNGADKQWATWTLHYKGESNGWTTLRRPSMQGVPADPGLGVSVTATVLETLTLPDQTTFTFGYDQTGVTPWGDSSGALISVKPPTGGEVTFDYAEHYYPPNSFVKHNHKNPMLPNKSLAVTKRTTKGKGGGVLGYRTYAYASDPIMPGVIPIEKSVVVTDYEGEGPGATILRKSQHFFSVCPDSCPAPTKRGEYSLPFSTKRPNLSAGAGAFLSSTTFGSSGFTEPVQHTYVTYEADVADLNTTTRGVTDWNRRMFGQTKIDVLPDQAKECLEERMLRHDGLGHYRDTTQSGTCGGTTGRTTTTTYNEPHTGVGGTPSWWPSSTTSALPPATDPWILNRYTSQSRTEGSDSSLAVFDFLGSGLLEKKRVYLGNSAGANDVVTAFEYSGGNLIRENHYGGANQALALTALDALSLPTPEYRVDHTYASGVLVKSQSFNGSVAMPFFSLDRDVDPSTGFTITARDTAGVPTGFEYDTSGRLTKTKPRGRAWTFYNWQPADNKVLVTAFPPDTAPPVPDTDPNVLARSEYHYDTLGRLTTERQLQPDRTFSARNTAYNVLGWKTSVSEWDSSNKTEFTYDALGRVRLITQPDGSTSRTEYTGSRLISRFVRINSATSPETKTNETYDAFGRLIELAEDAADTNLKTNYAYDADGNLTRVTQDAQTRIFVYDGAGRLESEDHPEAEITRYTYDSQGRLLSKRVGTGNFLKFEYDKAGRLLRVFESVIPNRNYKILTYDTTTVPVANDTIQQPGRLVRQQRLNYFNGVASPSLVTDYFNYDTSGRVSRKTTDIDGTLFFQDYDYTALGNPGHLNYPVCPSCGTVASNPRGIGLTYGAGGLLTDIAGITAAVDSTHPSGITYTRAGQVHKVRHARLNAAGVSAPGVIDIYEPDVMPRPKWIQFGDAPDCKLIQSPPSDVTVTTGSSAQFFVTAATTDVTFTWYAGTSGTTTTPIGTGTSITIPNVTQNGSYWVQATRAQGACVENSHTVRALVCGAPIIVTPSADYSGQPIPVLAGTGIPLAVDLSATAAVTYEWRQLAPGGESTIIGTEPTVDWVAPAVLGQYRLSVTVKSMCGSTPFTSTRLVKIVEVVSGACPKPVIATAFPAQMSVSNGKTRVYLEVTLSCPQGIDCTPQGPNDTTFWPTERNNTPNDYYFQWSEDGYVMQSGAGLWQYMTDVETGAAVSVEIWRICGTNRSPSETRSVYIFNIDACPIPPLTVDQTTLTVGQGNTKFTASSTWPSLTYEWFRGDSGNTREKVKTESNVAQSSYTPLQVPGTYWVRVSSGCGPHTDSPTLIVKSSSCSPVEFLRQPQSAQIAAGTMHTLDYDAVGTPMPSEFRWYGGPGNQELSKALTLSVAPKRTTSYWAEARIKLADNSTCHAGQSALATLHVISCSDINITQQPADQSLTVDAGATGSATIGITATSQFPLTYAWYYGESGNEASPVLVNGVPVTTPSLAVNLSTTTKYWVRVAIANGCAVDSRTVTVAVCQKPNITLNPLSRSIVANFPVWLAVETSGTNLTYQWYRGDPGITSDPIVEGIYRQVRIQTAVTRDYWVRVFSSCGFKDSTAAKISIPPTILTHPQSAPVTYGGTKQLSVAANGTQLRYEWYLGDASVLQPTLVYSSTSPQFTPPVPPGITAPTTYSVYVYSGGARVRSNFATLTPCLPKQVLKTQSAAMTAGEQVTLEVQDPQAGETYEWYLGQTGNTAQRIGTVYKIFVSPTVTTEYWLRTKRTGCDADSPTTTVRVCQPRIDTQPASIMVNPNQTTTLTVAATGPAPLTYQWYEGATGVTTTPVGTNSTQYTTPAMTADKSYWVRVSGPANSACGTTQNNSATAVVSVCKPPTITLQPLSRNTAAAQQNTVSVEAQGTDLTYQWYIGLTGDTSTLIDGATTASITVITNVTRDYWVKITGRCGTVNSQAAKLSIKPTITTQPVGGEVTKGTTRTLSVVASGTQLSYQWYLGTGTASPIPGATAASYPTPAINADTTYWVNVASGTNDQASTPATFTVCTARTVSETPTTRVSGSKVTLTVTNGVAGDTYEWYRGTTLIASGVSSINVYPAETTDYWMRTQRASCYADTSTINVKVCYPKIDAQPQGATVTSGSTRQLTVAATGTQPIAYQWYKGASGDTSQLITGATSNQYTTTPLTATTSYWVNVKSTNAGCGSEGVNSATATIAVCNPPAITNPGEPFDRGNLYPDTDNSLSITATGDNLSYQWYQGAAGVTTTPVGENSNILNFRATVSTSYWVRITGSCGTVDSRVAIISVKPKIQTQPQNATACANSTVQLSIAATGANLTYTWYKSLPGSPTSEEIGTQNPMPFTATTTVNVWCVVRSGNASTESNHVTLTVNRAPDVYSMTKSLVTGGYKLKANVYAGDVAEGVTYRWYQGPIGDTSTLKGTTNTITVNPPTPTTYWVRVTLVSNGCTTDRDIIAP